MARAERFRLEVDKSKTRADGPATGSGRWEGYRAERAILVGVDFTARARTGRTAPGSPQTSLGPGGGGLAGARAAVRLNGASTEDDSAAPPIPFTPSSSPAGSPGLSAEESLAEFRELVVSAGAQVAAELIQRRPRPDPATLIGAGKVEEIEAIAASTQAELVLIDHDLSPTQLRNLDAALPCRVLDRTQLILDIFARHARTREGQLQVELAQLEYMLPRLTGRGKAMSQLGGGIGTRGPGETQLETDRRRIQRRIDQLKLDIESVRRVRRQQRQRRESVPVPTVALVGYTNAGKSTLFNRITGAQVFESAQMFATLDPKLRAIELPSRRKVLLSDTVGFIRNLPHSLVTSFRATLEEVEQAEILLHVRDASSSYGEEQKAQVEKVLGELNALSKPRIEVLNKIDVLDTPQREGISSRAHAPAGLDVLVSARTGEGIDSLLAAIDLALFSDPVIEAELDVPQKEGAALAAIEAGMIIRQRTYKGNMVHLSVAGPASLIGKLREYKLRQGR